MCCLVKNRIQSFKKWFTDWDLVMLARGLQKDLGHNVAFCGNLVPGAYSPAFEDNLCCGRTFPCVVNGTSTARKWIKRIDLVKKQYFYFFVFPLRVTFWLEQLPEPARLPSRTDIVSIQRRKRCVGRQECVTAVLVRSRKLWWVMCLSGLWFYGQ